MKWRYVLMVFTVSTVFADESMPLWQRAIQPRISAGAEITTVDQKSEGTDSQGNPMEVDIHTQTNGPSSADVPIEQQMLQPGTTTTITETVGPNS